MFNLCPPALIYLFFCAAQIIIDLYKGLYNTAVFKFIIMIMITILLNALCQGGLGIISWMIVFIPFVVETTEVNDVTGFVSAGVVGTIATKLVVVVGNVIPAAVKSLSKHDNVILPLISAPVVILKEILAFIISVPDGSGRLKVAGVVTTSFFVIPSINSFL